MTPSNDFAARASYELYLEAGRELSRLEEAIRKHRDFRGDDRCWEDDEELYRTLPEGYEPPARDTAVELSNCQRFIECRRSPATEYISPQRRIEELQAENDRLKNVIRGALRIESLWLPAVVSKEHEHEVIALHMMRDNFLAALSPEWECPTELENVPIAFGLVAQGHIPTIARMLIEEKSWEEIGNAIGWCSVTAKQHYEWHLSRDEGN